MNAAALKSNLLLAALPRKEQRRLLRHLEPVTLQANETLHELGKPVEYAHFPLKGSLISFVKVLDDGKSFDAGVVGLDGVIGVEAFFGTDAQFVTVVRVAGEALRISKDDLQADTRIGGKWSEVIARYIQFLLVCVSQKSGCNRFHTLEKHFSAWLLTVHDRIQADEIPITHATFATMLGVRRVGITQAARKLRQAGLIRYSWGKLIILDRARLEAHACVCYRQHTQAYQRLLDPAWPDG